MKVWEGRGLMWEDLRGEVEGGGVRMRLMCVCE